MFSYLFAKCPADENNIQLSSTGTSSTVKAKGLKTSKQFLVLTVAKWQELCFGLWPLKAGHICGPDCLGSFMVLRPINQILFCPGSKRLTMTQHQTGLLNFDHLGQTSFISVDECNHEENGKRVIWIYIEGREGEKKRWSHHDNRGNGSLWERGVCYKPQPSH